MLILGGVGDLLNGLTIGRVIESEAAVRLLTNANATVQEILVFPW